VGGASKAFLTSDFVGQSYLCYLVPVKNELFFVKLEKTNNKEQLIFCTRTCVQARDAMPLTVRGLSFILDAKITLVLCRICR
jgi:anaphase-promoting complex subunit 1